MPGPSRERSHADDLLDEASDLIAADRFSEALAKCDEASALLATAGIGSSDAVALRELNTRALCIGGLGDPPGERDALERVIELAQDASDPEAVTERRAALANLALNYSNAGRDGDVIHLLQGEFIEWWPEDEDSRDAMYFVHGARTMAYALHRAGVSSGAIELLDMLIEEYGTSTDADAREHVAASFRVKAAICNEIDDHAEVIATYDRYLAYLGEPSEAETALEVAKTWIYRAYAREMNADPETADADRREVLRRFADCHDEDIERVKEIARQVLDR